MASSLGTAWIQIKPSLSGVSSNIKKELAGVPYDISDKISAGADSGGKKMSSALGSVFSGLGNNIKDTFAAAFKTVSTMSKAALIGATAGVTALLIKSTNLYADYEQLAGGVETLFKESANVVLEYSNRAFQTAQVSANEYMNTVTSFSASLLQSLGGDTAKAAAYADMAIIDMADNANKMGTSMESIQYAYQGFAKQNYTMLDNLKLGYGGTKTEMERLLAEASKISGIKFKIDSFADVVQAIHIIQENLGIAGTSSVEASETISGSLNSMKAAWKNVLTFFGGGTAMAWNDIFPQFIETVKTFGRNIIPVIGDILFNIAGIIKELAPVVIAALPELFSNILPPLIEAIVGIFSALVEVFPALIQSLVSAIKELLSNTEQIRTIVAGFVQLFVAVAGAAGEIIGAIIPLIPEIIGTLVSEITKPENCGTIVAAFGVLLGIATFKTITSNLGGVLKDTIGGKISSFFKTDLPTNSAKDIASGVGSLGNKISGAIKGIAGPIKTAFVELGNILGAVATAIMEPIKAIFKGLGQALAGFFSALANPAIAIGAAMFAVAAAAVAVAILAIGSAVGAVAEPLGNFVQKVLLPLGDWIKSTLLDLLDAITTGIIRLTQGAVIPLGNYMASMFVNIVNNVTNAMIRLTQGAVIPLINTVAGSLIGILNAVANVLQVVGNIVINVTNGAFIPLINTLAGSLVNILHTVGDILNGVISSALNGVKGVVQSVGSAFEQMGWGIRHVIDGVTGTIQAFGAIIQGVADAVVAIIAIANNRNISYGHGYAYVWGAATGGLVGGDGTQFSDSNLFALSKGEYVLRASAARQIGYDNLDAMNETGRLAGGDITNNITINGYDKDPNELANIISRKIAFRAKGVLA